MVIGVLKERSEEYRVAMVPEIMRKWPDCEFYVESNAGVKAGYSDEAFEAEGAHIEKGLGGFWNEHTSSSASTFLRKIPGLISNPEQLW